MPAPSEPQFETALNVEQEKGSPAQATALRLLPDSSVSVGLRKTDQQASAATQIDFEGVGSLPGCVFHFDSGVTRGIVARRHHSVLAFAKKR